MALSLEDIFGLFTLNNGTAEKIDTKQAAGNIQEDLISFASESEDENCNNSDENEDKFPDTHVIIFQENSTKQLESGVLAFNIDEMQEKKANLFEKEELFKKNGDIPDSSEENEIKFPDTHVIILQDNSSKQLESDGLTFNIDELHEKKATLFVNEKVFKKNSDIPDILACAYESEKSNKKQKKKMNRRVHFNTQVETFTFEPDSGIHENYNSMEEFTIENVCGGAFNEKRLHWKSESNLFISNPDSWSDYPIMGEGLRYDSRFRQLRNGCLYIPEYSNLNDEDTTDNPKKELFPRPKRTNSCIFRKKKDENENGLSGSVSGSLNRRFSVSMHNLKMGTKSIIDTLWTKVTKKKEDSFAIQEFSWAGDIIQDSVEEKKSKSRSPKTFNNFFGKKNGEDEDGGNIPLRSWKSMQNLNRKESLSTLSKLHTEDITDDSVKELKRRNSLFRKRLRECENADDKNGSAGAMSGDFAVRSWKSVQNLKDSKSWMDKFVTKVMKK